MNDFIDCHRLVVYPTRQQLFDAFDSALAITAEVPIHAHRCAPDLEVTTRAWYEARRDDSDLTWTEHVVVCERPYRFLRVSKRQQPILSIYMEPE